MPIGNLFNFITNFLNIKTHVRYKTCPTCGAKAKYKVKDNKETFSAVQDEEVLLKVEQLKKAMQKFKEKAEALEKELEALKSKE